MDLKIGSVSKFVLRGRKKIFEFVWKTKSQCHRPVSNSTKRRRVECVANNVGVGVVVGVGVRKASSFRQSEFAGDCEIKFQALEDFNAPLLLESWTVQLLILFENKPQLTFVSSILFYIWYHSTKCRCRRPLLVKISVAPLFNVPLI